MPVLYRALCLFTSRLSRQCCTRLLPVAVVAASLAAAPPMACAYSVPLIWHVESDDGKIVDSHDADQPVNPASVVKLATSLRALETLGPDRRFTTTFGVVDSGAANNASVEGLVVEGGADPDFHFENALMVARELVSAGVVNVRGDLHVGATFWMGWERGTVGREPDPIKRRLDMGRRLLAAWSPSTWTAEEKKSWAEIAEKRHWDPAHPPAVHVSGAPRTDMPPKWRPVVEHRSEPLIVALRRFNVYSNNDIERLDASIGPAAELSAFFEKRWGADGRKTSFATSSGLNSNRMTPRLIVRLLRDLRASLTAKGHVPADMMPVLGCGESTLYELFPRLRESGDANGLVGKTGTLNLQDGGVSALAGFVPVGPGLLFFVAAPGAGNELPKARGAEEDFVRTVLLRSGTVAPLKCPAPVPTSADEASVVRAAPR